MKQNIKKFAVIAAILLMALLCLTACGGKISAIPLGDGLPAWELSTPLYEETRPDKAADKALSAVYRTKDESSPEVQVYRYPKETGQTLEDLGQTLAAEHQVFCNMTEACGVPAANVTYYDPDQEVPCIVRAYIFEGETEFVKLCFLHGTEQTSLGQSDMVFRPICGYTEEENPDSVFPYEAVYTYQDEYLPTVRIRQFPGDVFPALESDGELAGCLTQEASGEYAMDGWTLEEIIGCYGEKFDLLKGEVIQRNGLRAGFIGYIDGGIFFVRAYIENGDEYVVICAENPAPVFQHVVNALIDSIGPGK